MVSVVSSLHVIRDTYFILHYTLSILYYYGFSRAPSTPMGLTNFIITHIYIRHGVEVEMLYTRYGTYFNGLEPEVIIIL